MSRREDIDNAIWSDPDFEELTLEATSLYLWSWTNPRCGMAGIYKVSLRAMAEAKVPADKLEPTLAELATSRFAFYEAGVMFVRTRVKHMRQKTEQIAKSIRADLAKIDPTHPLREAWVRENASAPWLIRFLGAGWEVQATLTGQSTEGHGVGSLEPDNRSSVEGHPTLPGSGNGNGTGNGPQGRGAGEGTTNADFFQMADDLGVDRGYVRHYLSRFTAHKRRPTAAEMYDLLKQHRTSEAA